MTTIIKIKCRLSIYIYKCEWCNLELSRGGKEITDNHKRWWKWGRATQEEKTPYTHAFCEQKHRNKLCTYTSPYTARFKMANEVNVWFRSGQTGRIRILSAVSSEWKKSTHTSETHCHFGRNPTKPKNMHLTSANMLFVILFPPPLSLSHLPFSSS